LIQILYIAVGTRADAHFADANAGIALEPAAPFGARQ
jgi:hypothetical protein